VAIPKLLLLRRQSQAESVHATPSSAGGCCGSLLGISRNSSLSLGPNSNRCTVIIGGSAPGLGGGVGAMVLIEIRFLQLNIEEFLPGLCGAGSCWYRGKSG
jgi:hypothetical protein